MCCPPTILSLQSIVQSETLSLEASLRGRSQALFCKMQSRPTRSYYDYIRCNSMTLFYTIIFTMTNALSCSIRVCHLSDSYYFCCCCRSSCHCCVQKLGRTPPGLSVTCASDSPRKLCRSSPSCDSSSSTCCLKACSTWTRCGGME